MIPFASNSFKVPKEIVAVIRPQVITPKRFTYVTKPIPKSEYFRDILVFQTNMPFAPLERIIKLLYKKNFTT